MYGNGKSDMQTYITICKIDSQRECAVRLRKLKQRLGIHLEGWGREGAGRRGSGWGDTWIRVAYSCWCMAKPSKYCKVIILQLKLINWKKIPPYLFVLIAHFFFHYWVIFQLYEYTTICLSIHLLKDIIITLKFWQLWIKLLWTSVCAGFL